MPVCCVALSRAALAVSAQRVELGQQALAAARETSQSATSEMTQEAGLLRLELQVSCISTRILGKSMRGAVRNKERRKGCRAPTQDPSTNRAHMGAQVHSSWK